MTTARPANPTPASAPAQRFRLPDIPEKHPDDMTSYNGLHQYGAAPNLIQHLGHSETTIVSAEHYVILGPDFDPSDSRYPDLLVAFDVDPAAYRARNGYVISEQSKPPDFILEVASQHTASADLGVKKDYYERLGVSEYWLFDSQGEFYGFTLRGYRLVQGQYEEMDVTEIAPEVFQGYSVALNLILRVDDGRLGWHDPSTGEHIPTLQSQTARVQELEAELRRLREGQ